MEDQDNTNTSILGNIPYGDVNSDKEGVIAIE